MFGALTSKLRKCVSSHSASSVPKNEQRSRVHFATSGRIVNYGYGLDGHVAWATTRKTPSDPEVAVYWWVEHYPWGGLGAGLLGNDLVYERHHDRTYAIDTIRAFPNAGGPDVFSQYYPRINGQLPLAYNDLLDDSYDLWLDYDDNGRVINGAITEGGLFVNHEYTYDLAGNRRTERQRPAGWTVPARTYNYPATSNRLTSVVEGSTTLRTFTYDAAGNITDDGRGGTAVDYAYDAAGRLRTVTVDSLLRGTYTYDGMDRLAVRTTSNQTPAGTTHLLYLLGDGGAFDALMPDAALMTGGWANRVIAEAGASGTSVREYIWVDDLPLMVIDDAAATATPYWVISDPLGRPAMMTDSDQDVVWRAGYRAFGEVASLTGPASLDLRFPGQWFQLEAGLAYNWHRHYDASLGRYVQPDPLGVAGGTNPYGYAGEGPTSMIDPEGLQSSPWRFARPTSPVPLLLWSFLKQIPLIQLFSSYAT